jgi:hypothetical protein
MATFSSTLKVIGFFCLFALSIYSIFFSDSKNLDWFVVLDTTQSDRVKPSFFSISKVDSSPWQRPCCGPPSQLIGLVLRPSLRSSVGSLTATSNGWSNDGKYRRTSAQTR